MDPGLDNNHKPPSTSYRETFRRHRKLLAMPVILGALAAGFFLFGTGKTYKSTADLWVDTAPPAVSSVSANADSAQAEPPAAAEQAILTELLTTRAFTASVAQTALRGQSADQAAALLGSGQVVPIAMGAQVLHISYAASSPAAARAVLAAIIAQLGDYTSRLTAQHDQATAAYDKAQVKAAAVSMAAARSSVNAYRAQHPGATSTTDPNYASLVAAETNAATQLAQANTALSQAAGNSQGWSIRVTDPPSQGSTTPLRKSKMAEVILAGVLGGLLVSFLAAVALTPGKKEAWEDELPIGRPLVPADPFLGGSPAVAPAQSPPPPTQVPHRRLLRGSRRFAVERGDGEDEGDERFQFLTPLAPSDRQ